MYSRRLWLIPVAAWVGMIGLSGCVGADRIAMRFQQFGCQMAGNVPVDDKCYEPFVAFDPPRFCYQVLGRVDCYAEPVRFGPDPGLLRAAPPDLGR